MTYSVTNSKGKKLYLHKTKGGTMFFSPKILKRANVEHPDNIPEDRTVVENKKTGLLFLKKK